MYNKNMEKKLMLSVIVIAFAAAATGILLLVFSYYTNESYLVLKGESDVTIGLSGVYEEPGAEFVILGRDISDKVSIEGEVDPQVPGEYTLTYKGGHFTMERKVTVLDHMNPVIALTGGDVTMKLGEAYTEPGYTAMDEEGNDLTDLVKVSKTNLKRAGKRELSYTVTDDKGNKTRVDRTVTVEPNTEYETSGIAICMYHYVYDENDVPSGVNGNYISTADLAEELEFLKEQDFYYPSWQEVRDYVDGKLLLPEKSVVLTFDDGAYSFLDNGIPVLEKYQVPATSFVITSNKGEKKMAKYQSEYVNFQSHSHNMHRPGGKIGHGGIMTAISHEEGVEDLKKSIEITGGGEAFAYPFGDINENCRSIVEDAGFICAVTTVPGRVKPGDDPLELPRQRMSRNQSLKAFSSMVMPFDKDEN